MIWDSYKNWIQSYRDLPILLNQWANVVRWEMPTRLFLRTTEFLWQEGHTAHATRQEAVDETLQMMNVYAEFVENYMALPVLKGKKTASERFAGAEDTYCIEGLMQDGKALQAGTSHFLGQNFAKAFDVKFSDKNNNLEYVWGTSWGVSTRLMGALVMAHSDDDGLILPPRLAPTQVVIVPIFRDEEQLSAVSEVANKLVADLRKQGLTVKYDNRDSFKPGWKFAEYEQKGVPVRIAIGPRDLANGEVEVARRDTKEKKTYALDGLTAVVVNLMDEIHQNIYQKALDFRENNISYVDTYDEFKEVLDTKGGFIYAHWDGTDETEQMIKEETKATIRLIPLEQEEEDGVCIYSGQPSKGRVVFAIAY